MGRKVTVAATTLNQWALDFDGNRNRILESIVKSKQLGATYRTGPELEICGYSCEDHFLESDTYLHSWEVLRDILLSPECENIIVDVGMPVMHRNVSYNCRVAFLNRLLLLIRPKTAMCEDGCYRESRWFSAWRKMHQMEDYFLPNIITEKTGQQTVKFGDAVIVTRDTSIGFEICEELWNPYSTHISMGIDGVEIIANGSGSYTELCKQYTIVNLLKTATFKSGGCYIYCNLRGCDGSRVYFNGCSNISMNGQILVQGEQFSLQDVEVIVATIDLEDIRLYRNKNRSRAHLGAVRPGYPRIFINFSLSQDHDCMLPTAQPIEWKYLTAEEEIAQGPALWLWDYLRRSGSGGFFLPISGGVDSTSTAVIVFSMCKMITEAFKNGDTRVKSDLKGVTGDCAYSPSSPQDLCKKLFFTSYMQSKNSSKESKSRADALAKQIGSYHIEINIDEPINALLKVFTDKTNFTPKFASNGGSHEEDVALQSIQARTRMVLSYLFGQLILASQKLPCSLLVLGSGNLEEALTGYLTKYDCSSADLNPIGGISKKNLIQFLTYAKDNFDIPIIGEILCANPTAELVPINGKAKQTDEEDMGMTYDELNTFGRYRKSLSCGPYSMFCKLVQTWQDNCNPQQVAAKVKNFFRCYAINRHKMAVLTPAYHCEGYSSDDNRFDHRPLLYRSDWFWQFNMIDQQFLRSSSKLNESSTKVISVDDEKISNMFTKNTKSAFKAKQPSLTVNSPSYYKPDTQPAKEESKNTLDNSQAKNDQIANNCNETCQARRK